MNSTIDPVQNLDGNKKVTTVLIYFTSDCDSAIKGNVTNINNMNLLILGVCILLSVLDQVEEFPSNATLISIVFYHFIQIIRFMFWSYDHLQVEIFPPEDGVALDGNPST
jgi:hypothetical protein